MGDSFAGLAVGLSLHTFEKPMKNSIRLRRAEKNMSQAELAKACDVSRHAIMAIEKQVHEPSIKLACKIAHALNTPLHEVFDLSDID